MKAIETSIWRDHLDDAIKSTIRDIFKESLKNNFLEKKITLDEYKEFQKQYSEFIDSIDWMLYYRPQFENIISKMVDEQFDWKSERVDLWKQIAINTSLQHSSWHMAVENADCVLNIFERKFNAKTGTDENNV